MCSRYFGSIGPFELFRDFTKAKSEKYGNTEREKRAGDN